MLANTGEKAEPHSSLLAVEPDSGLAQLQQGLTEHPENQLLVFVGQYAFFSTHLDLTLAPENF